VENFNILSQLLSGDTEKKTTKTIRKTDIWTTNQIQDIPNMKQEY